MKCFGFYFYYFELLNVNIDEIITNTISDVKLIFPYDMCVPLFYNHRISLIQEPKKIYECHVPLKGESNGLRYLIAIDILIHSITK